jgi:hypothetical protein
VLAIVGARRIEVNEWASEATIGHTPLGIVTVSYFRP